MNEIKICSIVPKDEIPKIWIGSSFIYEDEELTCEHIHKFDENGCINVCIGNEPYSCHRSKKEGLCHKQKV